jgi:hypothetical protein
MAKTKHQPTKTANREKLAIWVDLPDLAQLRGIQERIGVPVSESIRRAISTYLESLPKALR